MRSRGFVVLAVVAAAALSGCGMWRKSNVTTKAASKAAPADVAAKVGPRTITVTEIDESIRSELARIESERYEARKTRLDELIEDALLEDEANARGITKQLLIDKELAAKTPQPTDDEVKATFEKLKAPGGTTLEQLAPRIREVLASQASTARRNEYLNELRKKANVSVKLDPPRFKIDTSSGRVEGPDDAPITLIEFSDYQCPYCGRSQGAVEKVLDKYRGKVLHVFMDFPLTAIHPAASSAAVATHCADEQKKYREYQAVLFQHQREFSEDNYKKWAADLGLDGARFEACLLSKRFDERIQKSLAAGQAVGISGTPGFFVNGIAIRGAQPFEVFERTIDDELAR